VLLQNLEGVPVVFVNFNRFFDQQKALLEVERCFNFAEISFDEIRANHILSRVLDRNLLHHKNDSYRLPTQMQDLCSLIDICHKEYGYLRTFNANTIRGFI
jgi:hypothetical protein